MGDLFEHQGLHVRGLVHLSPLEALADCERGALLVDVREDYLVAMKAFALPGVHHLPFSNFRARRKRCRAVAWVRMASSHSAPGMGVGVLPKGAVLEMAKTKSSKVRSPVW